MGAGAKLEGCLIVDNKDRKYDGTTFANQMTKIANKLSPMAIGIKIEIAINGRNSREKTYMVRQLIFN